MKTVLALLAAAALALFIVLKSPALSAHPGMVDDGERLLHPAYSEGLPTWFMPLPAAAAALLGHHSGPLKPCLEKVLLLYGAILAYSLGAALRSRAAGFAAAGMTAFLYTCEHSSDLEQLLLALSLLALALLLAARRRFFAGAAGAAAFFVKAVAAPLVLFLPLRDPKRALALLAVPALSLALWLGAQRASGQKPIVMETKRASWNVIGGALGLVGTLEGDPYALAGISQDKDFQVWALEESLRHPWRWLKGFVNRVAFAIRLHPLLFLLALFGLWRLRAGAAGPAAASLGWLAGLFLFLHCLMTVNARYLAPFWLLIAPLAASALDPRKAEPENRWALPVAAPLLAFAAFVLLLVTAYPFRRRAEASFPAALARDSKDPWLWSRWGQDLQSKGERSEAAMAFERAWVLEPSPRRLNDLVLARFAEGSAEALTLSEGTDDPDLLLVRALALAEAGRTAEATETLQSAEARWRETKIVFNEGVRAADPDALERLRGRDNSLMDVALNAVLFKLAPERRLKLAKKLPPLPALKEAADAHSLCARGISKAAVGAYAEAVKDFEAAIKLDPAHLEAYSSLAAVRLEQGDTKAARDVLRLALERNPDMKDSTLYKTLQKDLSEVVR